MNGFFQIERNLLERLGRDDKLTAGDFRVLAAAMRDSKLPGDTVALGIDYLATATRLNRSSVIRSRKRLLALGYLSGIEKGKRGIARFVVARGGVRATPEQPRGGVDATCGRGGVDATCGTGATGTGGTDATGTSGVDATQRDTGYIETTAYTHANEKQSSLEDGMTSANGTENPHPEFDTGTTGTSGSSADPDVVGEPSPPTPPPAKPDSKVTPKKQYPGDLDADAEKLVDLYAELVKPKRDDASGSRKVFLGTAKRLLGEGKPSPDMERAIRNYAASRARLEQLEKDPEVARRYRWGFQTFFGPKFQHWKDYIAIDSQLPNAANISISSRDADSQWLQFYVELVEEKYGEDIARQYDAIGREQGSIKAAEKWLKGVSTCRTA
jgi:hypothetical protein